MSDSLIRRSDGEAAASDLRTELSNTYNVSGGTNTFNAVVEQQTIVNMPSGTVARTVDFSYCNIFVVKCKTFANSCFTIPKGRAYISGFDTAKVKSFPSLFMKTNGGYCCCPNTSQEFYFGFVNAIEDEGDFYRITYERRSASVLLQTHLNEVAVKCKITPVGPADVLDQTGWRIYHLDIIKALTDNGFDMRSI